MRGLYHKLSVVFLLFALTSLLNCKSKKEVVSSDNSSFREIPTEIKKANDDLNQVEAEKFEYFDNDYRRNIDHSYKSNIKTVLLYPEGQQLADPIIYLGSGTKLELHFDDLNSGTGEYTFKIQHCNADWQPSALLTPEYIQGLTNDFIRSPASSENTHYHYTHYSYTFPNSNFSLTKSGNYLIHVFQQDSIILTKRFMIADIKVSITTDLRQATMLEDREYKQELDFVIDHPGYEIIDPYRALQVAIYQNNRLDNMLIGIKPNFVKNEELVYNYQDINVFEGGHEFRPLDLKNFQFTSSMIKNFQVEPDSYFHAYLLPDEPRSFKIYTIQEDLNGKFYIKRDQAQNSNVESDYVFVHFSLLYDFPENDGDVYIIGQLSNWDCSDQNKMIYNYEKKQYERTILLKQGYYNYLYGFLQDKSKSAELSVIEGSHSETNNSYSIYVYYRQPGDNYDRLIGVNNINTVKKK